MTMAQILALGAPELPDGWFYRVAEQNYFGYTLQVREDRKRFGSRLIAEEVCYEEVKVWDDQAKTSWHWESVDPGDAVYNAAVQIQKRLAARKVRRERYVQWQALLGDHR